MGLAQGHTASKWQSGSISGLPDFPAQSLLYFVAGGGMAMGKRLRKDIFVCAEAQIMECALSLLPPLLCFQPGTSASSYSSSFLPFFHILVFISILNHHPHLFIALNRIAPPCCLSWVHGGDGHQDPAPIISHTFRDPDMSGKPNFLSLPRVQRLATPLSMLFASWGKVQLGPLPGSPPCQSKSLTSRTPRRQLETCRSRAHRGPTTNPFSPSQAQNPPRFEQASSGGILLQ